MKKVKKVLFALILVLFSFAIFACGGQSLKNDVKDWSNLLKSQKDSFANKKKITNTDFSITLLPGTKIEVQIPEDIKQYVKNSGIVIKDQLQIYIDNLPAGKKDEVFKESKITFIFKKGISKQSVELPIKLGYGLGETTYLEAKDIAVKNADEVKALLAKTYDKDKDGKFTIAKNLGFKDLIFVSKETKGKVLLADSKGNVVLVNDIKFPDLKQGEVITILNTKIANAFGILNVYPYEEGNSISVRTTGKNEASKLIYEEKDLKTLYDEVISKAKSTPKDDFPVANDGEGINFFKNNIKLLKISGFLFKDSSVGQATRSIFIINSSNEKFNFAYTSVESLSDKGSELIGKASLGSKVTVNGAIADYRYDAKEFRITIASLNFTELNDTEKTQFKANLILEQVKNSLPEFITKKGDLAVDLIKDSKLTVKYELIENQSYYNQVKLEEKTITFTVKENEEKKEKPVKIKVSVLNGNDEIKSMEFTVTLGFALITIEEARNKANGSEVKVIGAVSNVKKNKSDKTTNFTITGYKQGDKEFADLAIEFYNSGNYDFKEKDIITVKGQIEHHEKYGLQLKVTSAVLSGKADEILNKETELNSTNVNQIFADNGTGKNLLLKDFEADIKEDSLKDQATNNIIIILFGKEIKLSTKDKIFNKKDHAGKKVSVKLGLVSFYKKVANSNAEHSISADKANITFK